MSADSHRQSLAQLYRDFAERWEIEPVPPGTKWMGVLREMDGGYVTIVVGHDVGALRYNLTVAEREEPEEREPQSRG
jgi:hypothetical protein